MNAATTDGFAAALRAPVGQCLRLDDGSVRPLPSDRWLGPAAGADLRLLARARGPVLDVGCGPGRHVHALARRGVLAVGVDVSPVAVDLARRRGATAHEASIFEAIPGEGTWASALLLDGNLGIGGHPERLLRRVRALLAPDGRILVEVDPPGTTTRRVRARLEGPRGAGGWFPWALVSVDGIAAVAAGAGLRITDRWSDEGRCFADLR